MGRLGGGVASRESDLGGECHRLEVVEEAEVAGGGFGGGAEEEVGLSEEVEAALLPGGEDFFGGIPCRFCCIRQWILNQLDLLPYLEPDLDIPTIRHFLSLQALQAVRFFLSTTQR